MAEGDLSELVIRWLFASALAATPCILAAAFMMVLLPEKLVVFALVPVLFLFIILGLLIKEAILLFKAATDRTMDTTLFKWFQAIFYCVVIICSIHSGDLEQFTSFIPIISVCMFIIHLAYSIIALAAREKVPLSIYVGLLGSVLVGLIFIFSF